MDAQDFRSLQEAYMEVVMNELDESYIVGGIKQDVKKDTFSGFQL